MLKTFWQREPVLFMTLIQATLGMLLAFGVTLTPQQIGAIMTFAAAVIGFIIRSQVTPTSGATAPPAIDMTKRITVWLLACVAASLVSCAHPQVAPEAQPGYRLVQVVRGVNDVTTGAIAANHAGALSDDLERYVLTVNKQVLDVIQAHPSDYHELAVVVVHNARAALPPAVAALVNVWLDKTLAALQEVR